MCDGLADGDLTRNTGPDTRDEPGRMARSLDAAMTRLRATVATIEGSAASLAGATEQMTGTSALIGRAGRLGGGSGHRGDVVHDEQTR